MEVARRRKPSLALWTVNQLSRSDPTGVRDLLEAAGRLRRAHLREPREIPEAATRHRAALQHLMRQAALILAGAALRASPDVLRRVHATVSAAAADPSKHSLLRDGRLPEELEAGGFEVLGGMPRHLTLVRPEGKAEPAAPKRADRDAGKRRQAAEREARKVADRQAAAQRRQAAKVEAEAARRQRALDRAGRQAERLRAQLRKVEERIESERRERPAPLEARRRPV